MYDAIIIGMGPAGMSAGIYAKRAGLNVLMIDESAPGGLLNKITIVENYLGFKSISGPDLASNMFEHILNEKVPFKLAKVTNVVEENGIKKMTSTPVDLPQEFFRINRDIWYALTIKVGASFLILKKII